MNAFLLNIGLETLPLRMRRHCENSLRVATYLNAYEFVIYDFLDRLYESRRARERKKAKNGTLAKVE